MITTPTFLEAAVTILISAGAAFFIHYLLGKLKEAHSLPLRTLARASSPLLEWMIAIAGLFFAGQLLFDLPPDLSTKVRHLFLVVMSFWILFRWKNGYEEGFKNQTSSKQIDRALIEAVGRCSTILLLLVALLSVLDVLEIPLTAILTVGGIGALSVGLAAKEIFANFFAGFMIFLNRPFAAGDLISSKNKNFEGTVEEIGWYMTRIRNHNVSCPCYIPNALLTDAIIENKGRLYNRCIKESLRLRHCDIDKIEKIVKDIKAMLKSHADVDKTQPILVHFISSTETALVIEIALFTKILDYEASLAMQQDILIAAIRIIQANGAQLAVQITRWTSE